MHLTFGAGGGPCWTKMNETPGGETKRIIKYDGSHTHAVGSYRPDKTILFNLQLVNASALVNPPPTPVTEVHYQQAGLPFLEHYKEPKFDEETGKRRGLLRREDADRESRTVTLNTVDRKSDFVNVYEMEKPLGGRKLIEGLGCH